MAPHTTQPVAESLESRKLMASVGPVAETTPVPHAGDAADDTAIWVHPTDPSLSVVIGTDKQGGIAVYGLDGKQLSYRPDGKMNNVDIRYGFPVAGGGTIDLVVASNRSNNTLAVYRMNPATRSLEPAAARTITSGLNVYGLSLYRSARTGKYYAFVGDH